MSVKLRSKKLSNGSDSLYLDIYIKGNRYYETLDIKITKNDPYRKHKKEMAEAKRAKRELEIIADYHDVPKNFNGDEDFIEYFKKNYTDYSSRSSLNAFVKFLNKKTLNDKLPFKLLNEKVIEDYKEYLLNKYKNSTAWMYLIKLKTILNKAVKEKIISNNPGKHISIKLLDIEKTFLTENELKLLAETETENIEVKKAFLFSCFTGLRISDVKKLTWSQIREQKLFFRQTKTKKIEYLPLAESALKYLNLNINKSEINPEDNVFKLGTEETVNNQLRAWAKKAKINKYLTFHSARHTFGTLSLSSGNDIYTVSKMMGHKSVKMTEIYAKVINKTIDEAITKLPKI